MIPFSILDLAPIPEGSDASRAFANTRDLAQHAEGWGYNRYWLAEHHNMPGIGSSATSVLMAHVAGATKTIRVGSGGVMLPNHAPLVIAEQFGTLESLFPGRIDLGLGRAPGTDMLTARALRRDLETNANQFPQDVLELQALFAKPQEGQRVHAVPGEGLEVPIWLLGSSLFSAQLAAMLGLPFAFASHFAPEMLHQALEVYRSRFEPSDQLDRPHAMLGIGAVLAETDAEARLLFTSQQQQFANLRMGMPGKLPPPREDMDAFWTPQARQLVETTLRYSFVGAPETVLPRLRTFLEETQADELMITGQIFDHAARLRSFEMMAGLRDRLRAPAAAEAASG
ncbi:LLM class flavin-dependent oxidoreductase [Lutibaculum baratangense]|uniref:Luciferase-like monooxygenase n=1 Tax=Lutibaculum baratangense AMV1 TaxID=631454 RepID=V4RJ74_9HYPH|nr:LLM class flavin-dependent oxidoreductase [Lutibaculum baratangense]ESR23320.1 Coenzyme F420-dependent N5,N10-methylene tetrahydromethanopterin reductase [Lutibaculum baratangense AMV1]